VFFMKIPGEEKFFRLFIEQLESLAPSDSAQMKSLFFNNSLMQNLILFTAFHNLQGDGDANVRFEHCFC
jgi:hypothetical protein